MYTSGSIMSLNPDFMYYASFMCMCRMPEISYHQELVQEGYKSYIHSIRCWLISFLGFDLPSFNCFENFKAFLGRLR